MPVRSKVAASAVCCARRPILAAVGRILELLHHETVNIGARLDADDDPDHNCSDGTGPALRLDLFARCPPSVFRHDLCRYQLDCQHDAEGNDEEIVHVSEDGHEIRNKGRWATARRLPHPAATARRH